MSIGAQGEKGWTEKSEISHIPGIIAGIATALAGWFLLGKGNTVSIMDAESSSPLATLRGVFLHPPLEAKAVVCLLLCIAVATIVTAWQHHRRLSQEFANLRLCRGALADSPDDALPLDIYTNISLGGLGTEPSYSTLRRAVTSVWNCHQLQTPDLEAISGSLTALEETKGGVGSTIGNRLMLLSLLGTVIGLAKVISTLQPQLSAVRGTGDVQGLLDNLQGTLTQMGVAFSSTAWGIVLASIISWIAAGLADRRASFLAETQFFAVSELAPRLLPGGTQTAINEMSQILQEGQEFIRQSRDMLTSACSEQKTLLDSILQESGVFLKAQRAEANNLYQKSAKFIAGVEKTLEVATSHIHQEIVSAGNYVVDGAKAQIKVAEQLDNALQASAQDMSAAANALKNSAQTLQTLNASATQLQQSVNDLKASLEANIVKIDAAEQQREKRVLTATDAQMQAQRLLIIEVETRLKAVVAETAQLIQRIDPKLPSPQDWTRLQQVLQHATSAAEAMARGQGSLSSQMIEQAMSNAVAPVWQEAHLINLNLNNLNQQLTGGQQTAGQQPRRSVYVQSSSANPAASQSVSSGSDPVRPTNVRPSSSTPPSNVRPSSPAPRPLKTDSPQGAVVNDEKPSLLKKLWPFNKR